MAAHIYCLLRVVKFLRDRILIDRRIPVVLCTWLLIVSAWTYSKVSEVNLMHADNKTDSESSVVHEVRDSNIHGSKLGPPRSYLWDIGKNMNLLTLFTTFKPNISRKPLYEVAIRNWGKLCKCVQPVLYSDNENDDPLAEYAKLHGWHVYPVPRANNNSTPYLKDMYLHAQEHYDSTYYGYANGDLIFDVTLVETLLAIMNSHFNTSSGSSEKVMIAGQRTNFHLRDPRRPPHQDTVPDILIKGSKAATEVVLDSNRAVDYFITRPGSISWSEFPDFVIGRHTWDSYLIFHARNIEHIDIIDITKTVKVLHLQGVNYQLTHRTDNDRDTDFNAPILENTCEKFPNKTKCIKQAVDGSLESAMYITKRSVHMGKIVIKNKSD